MGLVRLPRGVCSMQCFPDSFSTKLFSSPFTLRACFDTLRHASTCVVQSALLKAWVCRAWPTLLSQASSGPARLPDLRHAPPSFPACRAAVAPRTCFTVTHIGTLCALCWGCGHLLAHLINFPLPSPRPSATCFSLRPHFPRGLSLGHRLWGQ